ncbi:SNF2 family N-terminal domain-containing protein [Gorgonomyces haynaldii]|nr:SNF2 family N-terminal domain-containing protein [Gorgonomyces haynaldii]
MLSHYQTIAPKPFEQPPLPPAPNFQSWEQYQQQVQTRHQLPQPLPNGDQFVRPTKFNYTREDRQVETAKRQVERLYETFSSIDLPEAIQDDLLQTDLHKHQRQGLYFLLQREEVPKYESGIWIKEHDQYKNQITDTYASDEPYPVLGGILCDEMGVGKTLQMIALILSTLPSQPLTQPKRKDDIPGRGIYPSKSTLIVCPLSTVSNWEEQVQTHTKNRALSVYVFHGQSRSDDPEYIAKHDVVITTYSTLALQIKKERVGPLLEIYWFRVILDEAHIIKTVSTAQSKACHLLTASRRWCLTGTPIQNKIDDLYSLIKFLQIEPLNVKANWQRYITKNMKSADSLGMKRLQALMKIIALRRTKDQKIDGQPIIHLPSKRETIRMIELASAERVKYDHIHETAKQFFKSLMKKGQVMQNYVHILEAILRMRQACNHPSLVKDDWFESLQETENTLEHARRTYQLLKETGEDICQCGAPVDDMIFVSDCSHLCCADCRAKKQCITCGKKDHFVQVMDQDLEPLLNGSCTKIEELVRDLKEVKQQDPSIKSIVFSQWTSMLQLIKDQLSHHGFKSVALTGQMTRQQRYEAMETFKSDDRYTVFLVSLQSGGVGLNLVRASRVYIIEPYWNPAVESQAIDRVHRLGQTRPVEAIRFIIKRSIEENMLALQQYKMELAQDAFREKKRKQVQVERLESLRMLFD